MIVLSAIHKNNSDRVYTIRIHDREFAGPDSTTEFKCDPYFFKFKNEGDDNDPYKRIIPSSLEFTVLTGSVEYTETQKTAIATFYEGLTNSYEGRYYVEVMSVGLVIFRGKILPDVGDYLLENIGDFIVVAIDGLTDLKNIQYRPTTYSDLLPTDNIKTISFADHFTDILLRLEALQFFKDRYLADIMPGDSTSYPIFSYATNWIDESIDFARPLLDQLMVRNYWFEQKNKTYRVYENCWDVLTDLLTGLNARLYWNNGMYHMEQLGYMDNPAPDIIIEHRRINAADEIIAGETAVIKTQWNYDTNDNLQAGRGITQRRLPAFKAVELEQVKAFFNYINGLEFTVPDNPGPFDFGYVIGSGQKMVIQWFIEIYMGTGFSTIPFASVMKVEYIFTLKVKMGDYYLVADNPIYDGEVRVYPSGDFHVSSGGTVPELNWTLVDTDLIIRWENTFNASNINDFYNQNSNWRQAITSSALILGSTEIQEDGNIVAEFVSFACKVNNVTVGGFPPSGLKLKKTSRLIIASGYNDLYEQPAEIKRYEVGDARNTLIYPIKCRYYDGESKNFLGQLFLDPPEGSGITYEIPTTAWYDGDIGGPYLIQDLMLKQILAMRAKPTNTIKISLFMLSSSLLSFTDQIVFRGDVYIPINMEMMGSGAGGYTTWNATLWVVTKDYVGINVVDTGTQYDPSDTPVPFPQSNDLIYATPGLVPSAIEYHEEWTDIATAYVTPVDDQLIFYVDTTSDADAEIKKKWGVYINGVKQRYIADGPLVMGSYRFDVDLNRVLLVKGSTNIRHVEITKYR